MPQNWHVAQERAFRMIGGVLLGVSFLWLGAGLVHVHAHPVIGWLPLPVMAVLAARTCRRAAQDARFDAGTKRFWHHLGVACLVLAIAIVANAWDAVSGPEPSQRLSPVTLVLYLTVLAMAIWALLRLPAWHRSRADWIRFGLDACVMLVTAVAFVWHFSLREHQVWREQTGSAAAMLSICVVAFVSMVTFAKVAFAGAGLLDRRALHVLATGTAISAIFGGMSPFLIDRPYLSSSFVAVSTAAFSVQLAAGRQLRAEPVTAARRRRSKRINLVPYVAVASADALLLLTGTGDPHETTIMEVTSVVLTALVVARQIVVLRDNQRLLDTVDANLGQLQHYQDQLKHDATHDRLTGIGNRALFEHRAGELLQRDAALHVMVLDLDDFKMVNDRLGHGMGDQLIRTIAARLDRTAGTRGSVARLGGDEFVVVVGAIDPAELDSLLDALLSALHEPVELDSVEMTPRVSIGITKGVDGEPPQELLRRADVAMYTAKAAGGDRRAWFDPIMDTIAEETARLGADLRKGLQQKEFQLLYQPIVRLPGGELSGVEALLRWHHPEHGLVPPDVFIPLAEDNGFIVELGYWVLEQACRQAAAWQHEHGPAAPGRVSVNVSARQLAEPGFVQTVAGIIERSGADRRCLLIEVTETAVLSAETAAPVLTALRELGLQIALDDFGTGHSSLSLLLECPVDVLKVDKSFVSGSASEGTGAVIVENIIGFTTGLRMQAVAEGVETGDQATRLHAAGYDYAQGYHFARPMSAGDLDAAMRTSTRSLSGPTSR
ncbi:bifunctional diguanylate cyclase/phosphodiesterase [Actinoplanes sp. TFC3]|uniref:putative bifunctional diguanylate cyclase/phosphodiesterase n=1 Tax=Actinoplanes sp. TFC3 TaxID=1710355 RepID=UPI0008305F94|nr:bifunctional diguanylate cyclase/phosphodiesterase [Actinoplanes sp. TFC3]